MLSMKAAKKQDCQWISPLPPETCCDCAARIFPSLSLFHSNKWDRTKLKFRFGGRPQQRRQGPYNHVAGIVASRARILDRPVRGRAVGCNFSSVAKSAPIYVLWSSLGSVPGISFEVVGGLDFAN